MIMLASDTQDAWTLFLEYVKKRCSATAFKNWLEPISVREATANEITLEVPNIFVKEYLISNYKKELISFVPVTAQGEPAINFVIITPVKKTSESPLTHPSLQKRLSHQERFYEVSLNQNYRFDTFIEGSNNQFAKSAAIGVATRPGQSYNPLFIHGGVGLGKTHLLHSIGHFVRGKEKKLRVHCITTEAFVNDLVESLRNKSLDRLKRFYRLEVDVLLVDDIQFLQNRLNFEEELCNLFESFRNRNKQIVITSDKPPSQLKLSERMIARMEWGLVVHIGVPELETRVAILQHKAQLKGLNIPNNVAFFIAEQLDNNVRQLEGAINKLSAHCRLLELEITEEIVKATLSEMLQRTPRERISVEEVLKSVATIFQVEGGVRALKGSGRKKIVVLPRQVAMYLAHKLINDSLQMLGISFGGRAHSTIIHACRSIEKRMAEDEILRRKISMVERDIYSQKA